MGSKQLPEANSHSRRTALLPGSGIDLTRFQPAAARATSEDGTFRFLLVARLLWDKGVGEFVEAARQVRLQAPHARFQILGFLDVENRTAVSRDTVEAWVAEGVVEYLGTADDVRPYLAAADCVVLPSYREGTPRTLLEAAAMAKPLIATDVPGCREVVDDGRNGYLCPARDADGLAGCMIRMLNGDPSVSSQMGREGRRKMEENFDERIVIRRYLKALAELFARP
jgi:glycosyltransferase involved in cell wall biosynthesis